jgi:hypothetical protein
VVFKGRSVPHPEVALLADRKWTLLAACLLVVFGSACEAETFEVGVSFVLADGQEAFGGDRYDPPDNLTLTVDYGDDVGWTFFDEAPDGSWSIPNLPEGDAVYWSASRSAARRAHSPSVRQGRCAAPVGTSRRPMSKTLELSTTAR